MNILLHSSTEHFKTVKSKFDLLPDGLQACLVKPLLVVKGVLQELQIIADEFPIEMVVVLCSAPSGLLLVFSVLF